MGEPKKKGDDGGCFSAALEAVRTFGGVLEHPKDSHAWGAFGLNRPPLEGGWVRADELGAWACRIDQGHYGHAARKATWLYVFGGERPIQLPWERFVPPDNGKTYATRGVLERMSKKARAATPPAFRDLLLSIARSAR